MQSNAGRIHAMRRLTAASAPGARPGPRRVTACTGDAAGIKRRLVA